MSDDDSPALVPGIPMPARTLIREAGSGRHLLRIEGYMPLPMGARVQLGGGGDPPSDGEVTGMYVWGAAPPGNITTLVLEVVLVAPGETIPGL
jgi:hypothetical protein